jgi:hypothetical protein
MQLFSFLLTISSVYSLILVPKPIVSILDLDTFNVEHDIHVLASIGDTVIYKTNNTSFLGTLEQFFDIEEEQVYRVGSIRKSIYNFYEDVDRMLFGNVSAVPWHLDRISKRNLPLDGKYPYNSKGSCHRNSNVNIETVVVDTGVQSHIEFGNNQPTFLENFSGDKIDEDCNSHGTFCSSQIGGLNSGVCKSAKLYAVKVLTCEGSGSTSGVIAGMDYVFKRHVEREKKNPKLRTIMSMSLGGGYSAAMNRVVEKMVKISDTFYIVVASGNENQDARKTSPASARGILTANAMDKYDQRAYFSNFGPYTDIYSPGVDNYGAVLDNKYAVESGTSFSTPILAGVMNHYLDMYPDLNMKQLKEKILSDATKNTIEGNPKNTPNLMVYLNRGN